MVRWLLVGVMLGVMAWPAGAEIRLVDGTGRAVRLQAPPARIVSLTPSVTEILFALGQGKKVVGVSASDTWPPEVKKLPRVASLQPNYEAIITLRPDLVMLEAPLHPGVVARLEKLKIPTLALVSGDLAQFNQSVRTVGKATGSEPMAAMLLKKMARRLAAVAARIPKEKRPAVFIEIWNRPLQTAGHSTFIHEVVELAGGRNVFADLKGYPQVTPEALLLKDPQVVVLTTSEPDTFRQTRGFKALSARIYRYQPPDTLVRPSPRLADAVETLYRMFYPESR